VGIESLVSLLVYLLIGGLIVYFVVWIVSLIPIPVVARNIITAIVALILLLWILRSLGVWIP